MPQAKLPDRSVIEVAGEDSVSFLQGLVSNDVAAAAYGQAVWAALLTPQGKWLADFFIFAFGDQLLLDCEAAAAPDLARRLSRFRLRSRVTIKVSPDWSVRAGWGHTPKYAEIWAPDPRLPEAGFRILTTPDAWADVDFAAWDRHRLVLGLPDGSRDLDAESTVLLEAGFDELHGISWTKGCYMGQELTARTKYRGLLKRRLVPVSVSGPLPPRGTPITRDGAEVGTMRSGRDDLGLAVLRLEALEASALTCGEAVVTPRVPAWMRLPERAA